MEENQLRYCVKCGAELQEGQLFCSKCGRKIESNTKSKKTKSKNNKKGLKIFLSILAGIILLTLSTFVILKLVVKNDFRAMFSHYETKGWCGISEDGKFMLLDTNRLDIEDYFDKDAWYAIEDINAKLGFTEGLNYKMLHTSALDRRQIESNKHYTVTWSYHPDSGIEVTYEINQ